MRYWLMKSEPSDFSIDDLRRKKREPWTGVRNFQARNFMRNEMRPGDHIVFYHSNGNPSGAAGIARVRGAPYPDPTQFERRGRYFDPRATKSRPVWYVVDVVFKKKFAHIVSLEALKGERALGRSMLWTHNRLSVIPLTRTEFARIETLGRMKRQMVLGKISG